MGCLIIIGGGVVGFILCIVVGALLHTTTGSVEVAATGGLIAFAVCICLGFDYSSKFGEKKPEELRGPPSKTTRELGSSSSAKISHDNCPNCSNGNVRSWQGEMRCWNCGHVLKEGNILEQRDLESASPPIIEEPIAPALEEPQAQLLALLRTRASTIAPVVEEPEAQPEPVATEPATVNVVDTAIGMTSSEATKVLQKARPDLGTFDVYGLLRDFPKSVAENLPRDEAEKIKQELEDAGCTVELK